MDTIFYSWQSDLEARVSRHIIQDALKQAIKDLKRDPNLAIEATIDRATDMTAGSTDIPNAIMAKIGKARVFVADVSIINGELVAIAQANPKQFSCVPDRSPNPNVLFELGYAAGAIGWERTIMVMNTAFGCLSESEGLNPRIVLPFDLGYRRVMTFFLAPNAVSEVIKSAHLELVKDFREALKPIFGLPATIENFSRPVIVLHKSYSHAGECNFVVNADGRTFYSLRAGLVGRTGTETHLNAQPILSPAKDMRVTVNVRETFPIERNTFYCEFKTGDDQHFRIERDFAWIRAEDGPKETGDHRVYRQVSGKWVEINPAS